LLAQAEYLNKAIFDLDQRTNDLENKSFFMQATSNKDKQTCLKITDPTKEKEILVILVRLMQPTRKT